MDKMITKGQSFIDERGRRVYFNGMNMDDKRIGQNQFRYNLDEEFFKKYTANGFNLIRLAVTWENLEPEIEKYNESYLKSIDAIFSLAEKYGVYILIDMHQDLFSGFNGIGAGDGAPDWACITDGHEPAVHKFVWIEGYIFGKWVHACFDHFWNNDMVCGKGLQDRFADLWQMLARRYGNSPALFGFDLLNEPFPGSDGVPMVKKLAKSAIREVLTSKKINKSRIIKSVFKKDMQAMLDNIGGDVVRDIMQDVDSLAAEFDNKRYSPFLNKITKAIRASTPNGIIMIEQSFLCNGGVKQSVPLITVDGKIEPLQCFGPHSYDMTVDTPLYKYANADRVKGFFNEMLNTQKRLDVPVIVGEWGGCSNNRDTSWFPHAFELLDYFDENNWGQLYWDYHGDDMDAPLMDMLSRTHAVAVYADEIKAATDRKNCTYTVEFHCKNDGENIFYVHKAADILCNGEIETIKQYENGARLVGIRLSAGMQKVIVHFK